MKNYEIIKTEDKFDLDEVYSESSFDYVEEYGPTISLDYKTPVKKDIFIKYYLTDSSLLCNSNDKKVVVLLKKDYDEVYSSIEHGYVLSDDFEQYVYTCDDDSEINDVINNIGIYIIKKSYFLCPIYNRSIRLNDNKMIISSNNICFIKILNKDDIKLNKYNKLENDNIINTVYDFIIESKNNISFEELENELNKFLVVINNKYGNINNVYVCNESDENINDSFSARTLLFETDKNVIAVCMGEID